MSVSGGDEINGKLEEGLRSCVSQFFFDNLDVLSFLTRHSPERKSTKNFLVKKHLEFLKPILCLWTLNPYLDYNNKTTKHIK